MKKWLIRGLLVLVVAGIGFAAYSVYTLRSHGFLRWPVYETEAPEIPVLERPAILVFSKTNSFIHKEAIPAAESMFRSLAERNGWSIYITQNGAVHNPQDLARFDTIIWNNVTGDVLTGSQQQAMIDYIESGGGWIGIHGAGDSSSDWDWYENALIGAQCTGHPFKPQFQQATIDVEQADDPIMAHLDSKWVRTDEWYSFAESPRKAGMTILATLDESTYSPVDHFGDNIGMGQDHPIIWKQCLGQGRALYSALGHTAESYTEPEYVTLLEQALLWTAQISGVSCPQ